MIEAVLPTTVGWAERFDDAVTGDLFPEEQGVMAGAVEKRRREFTTGRWCARRALEDVGFRPVAIPPLQRGAPGWPLGAVGSITHCSGYRAAVAARSEAIVTVGIDAEPNRTLPAGVLDAVSSEVERRCLPDLTRRLPVVSWDRLLFSAKESVYKAWFPLARCGLEFDKARVGFELDGTFSAELLVEGPVVDGHNRLTTFPGRWAATDGLLVTAVVLPWR
ncbi:4'-phosphopantetheinyl transferase superfamily protein [Micromonospora sp. Llam7]|uniref:4'-phosphopantetheinyl transferase family protein n=1 Tax=Micromonospora tarapacensis TaxID=2835305 RepID=UPI001C83E209|nr:4'-phosphopantetheinyl transferase superfamily protein [Micromonospora tarapacensis]MBX7268153.1 4'-phosphopantetheinyl transferase superfamily protein [Micromonospora tarapacensis]